jgi:hypothetical protein
MTDHIIDGHAIGRQQLLQMLREVCISASALCDSAVIASGQWQDRAGPAVKSCFILQRGLISSHPQLADELHLLATEIQIALAAQSDNEVFAARIQKIKDTIHRLQQSDINLSPRSA